MKGLLGLTYLKVELSFAYQLDNELASCYQRAHHAGRSQLITSLILISNALSFRYTSLPFGDIRCRTVGATTATERESQ